MVKVLPQSYFEFGALHTNTASRETGKNLKADTYTPGKVVVFQVAPGQFMPAAYLLEFTTTKVTHPLDIIHSLIYDNPV